MLNLRTLVAILLLANLGYFAWTQGWVDAITGLDAAQREPKRMAQQIAPDATTLYTTQTQAVQAALKDATSAKCVPKPERWMVYLGPYKKGDLEKKKTELSKLKIKAAEVSKPSLIFGLSLGEFASEALAIDALEALKPAGIKTATVVLWEAKLSCP